MAALMQNFAFVIQVDVLLEVCKIGILDTKLKKTLLLPLAGSGTQLKMKFFGVISEIIHCL